MTAGRRTLRAVGCILKVNHAGEHSAISIYKAQLWVAGWWHKDLAPFLLETLRHEISHRASFRNAMLSRKTTPCAALPLWGIGGFVLGFLTALMGRNAIMICTKAVEQTVHRHLNEQLDFLAGRDETLRTLIATIQVEEDAHLAYAALRVKPSRFAAPLEKAIDVLTEILIWLSTQGAVTRMQNHIRQA